jgi:hypothetical protein
MVDFKNAKPLFETVMPKMIIYGTNGIGKSRFAMHAPNAIFLDFDKNLGQYKVVTNKSEGISYPLETFQQVIDFITLLINEPHDFKTVILDTFSSLNMIIENQVKLERNIASVGALPFGEGYHYTKVLWEQILRKLDFLWEKRKVMLILLGHDQIKEIKDPINGNYHGYEIALNEKIITMFRHWCSIMLYATNVKRFREEKGKFGNVNKRLSESKRVLYTEGDELFIAKNTYNLPPIIPFDDVEKAWTVFFNHINSYYQPKAAQPEQKGEK